MFTQYEDAGWSEPIPGIFMKSTVWGDKTLMTRFKLARDSQLPLHSHPHEQTGTLISGHIILTVGDETYDVFPGDCWCIPGDVGHGAQIMEDSDAIEVFSPVREDYIQ